MINKENNQLWTKNFTIITLGSIISMLGNAISNFAIGLLVLDYSKSGFLYALYMVVYNLPSVIMPTIAGTFIDKFSRRKMIYTLDFISAALYTLLALLMTKNIFNYPILLISCVLLGSIQSIYQVAYDSFYPMLITEGNYSKAYSIASTLQTMSLVMVPVSAFLYNLVGIIPIFLFNMVTFLIAAILETQIKAKEEYAKKEGEGFSLNEYKKTFKEGLEYIKGEKGLQSITKYFTVTMFAGGAMQVLLLPYFKANYDHGEYVFICVAGCMVLGRTIGGVIHYKFKYPVDKKFNIAIIVYTALSFIDGSILFWPIPIMMILCFIEGIMGITSYNIRISATQSYVEDSKKGRFNGMFQMSVTLGMLMGQLLAGIFSEFIGEKIIIVSVMIINFIAVLNVVYSNRKYIKPIYNRES